MMEIYLHELRIREHLAEAQRLAEHQRLMARPTVARRTLGHWLRDLFPGHGHGHCAEPAVTGTRP